MKTETTAVNADNNLIQIDIEAKYLAEVLTAVNNVPYDEAEAFKKSANGGYIYQYHTAQVVSITGDGIFHPGKTEIASGTCCLFKVVPVCEAIPDLLACFHKDEVKNIVKVLQPKTKMNGSMVTLKFAGERGNQSMTVEAPGIHQEYPDYLNCDKHKYMGRSGTHNRMEQIIFYYAITITKVQDLNDILEKGIAEYKHLTKTGKNNGVFLKIYPRTLTFQFVVVYSRGQRRKKSPEYPLPASFSLTKGKHELDEIEADGETRKCITLGTRLLQQYTCSVRNDQDLVLEMTLHKPDINEDEDNHENFIMLHHNSEVDGLGAIMQNRLW